MIRLFNRHNKRKIHCLDGMWKFKSDPENIGEREAWYINFPDNCESAVVPSCWNNELGMYHYEGTCWYKTEVEIQAEHINLVFHGVTGEAKVYFDGDYLGSHYGGFTGFSFEIDNLKSGVHDIVVSVDNTHNNINTIPLAVVDWFHYGGITRSVELMELNDAWIKDFKIGYELDNSLSNANVSFSLSLSTRAQYKGPLRIYCNNEIIHSSEISFTGEDIIKVNNILIKDVMLWDVFKPNLYTFTAEIAHDDITERTGFRKIHTEDRKIYINNKPLNIKGVNRHEDHPDWGFAIPFKLMKKDMDIIKKLGCNAIRGSHYPNAPIFLDLCDEEGILFWEEIPMWGFPEEPLKNSLTLDRGLMMHREMVDRDYNHPSIIIWGLHNEIATDTQAGFEITKAFSTQIRKMDSSRLITYATNRPLDDICYSLVDFVSANVYVGWYDFYDPEVCDWKIYLKKLDEKLKSEGLGQLPVIMSEFGAGAIYGDKCFEDRKWSETFQADYLENTLNIFKDNDMISGTYIWQYCDIRTPKENEMSRPRSFNNKGIVNEYRLPKLGYWAVQRKYHEN